MIDRRCFGPRCSRALPAEDENPERRYCSRRCHDAANRARRMVCPDVELLAAWRAGPTYFAAKPCRVSGSVPF